MNISGDVIGFLQHEAEQVIEYSCHQTSQKMASHL